MQTNLADFIKASPDGEKANDILRSCVHCGFCNATCPTYQLLGSELDGPRGRIYLIKQLLEGAPVTRKTQVHLDRCLSCRNCETTCPSGVKYGELLKIGRSLTDKVVTRSVGNRVFRKALLTVLPYESRFTPLLKMGQLFRPLLPPILKTKIPAKQTLAPTAKETHKRKVIILRGCAQPGLKPKTDHALTQLLNKLGIECVSSPEVGCCGAIHEHMGEEPTAHKLMKNNIDAWMGLLENGAEAIVMTASGCGSVVKDYEQFLADDAEYQSKAALISGKTVDVSEFLSAENIQFSNDTVATKVAWHAPCTLQHHQKITGVVEKLLTQAGYQLTTVKDAHLCCGSAGTYSLLQPELSQQLKVNKVNALNSGKPDVIVTANIGCQVHLESGTDTPVQHWLELLEQRLAQ